MCGPILQIGLAVVGGIMQMQQANAQASAISATAANNMKIAEYNSGIEKRAAADAISRGAEDASVIRQNSIKANATARAQMGSSGLLTDTGTNLNLIAQNAGIGELNALTRTNNAQREATGHLDNATSILFGGKVGQANASYQSSVVRQNGLLDAAGTLVTGVGNYGKSVGWFK